MQNPTQHNPNGSSNQLWERFRAWLAENPWAGIIIIILLAIIIYQQCKGPGTTTGGIPGLTFDPVNGGVIADSLGNRDGQINPGEQVNVRLRLSNTGKERIPAFTLVFATPDSGVTFIDDRVGFDAIPPGESVLSRDPFEFKMPDRFVPHCVMFHGDVQNEVRAGFAVAAPAADTPPDVVITYPVAPNYRVCVGACTLEANVEAPDVLTIELKLCNGSVSGGPTLSNPSVEIVDLTLRACKPLAPTEPPEIITPVQNNLQYSTVGPGACSDPSSPLMTTFKFNVPPTWESSATGDDICVHFTANIYSDPLRVWQATAYVGVKATVLLPIP